MMKQLKKRISHLLERRKKKPCGLSLSELHVSTPVLEMDMRSNVSYQDISTSNCGCLLAKGQRKRKLKKEEILSRTLMGGANVSGDSGADPYGENADGETKGSSNEEGPPIYLSTCSAPASLGTRRSAIGSKTTISITETDGSDRQIKPYWSKPLVSETSSVTGSEPDCERSRIVRKSTTKVSGTFVTFSRNSSTSQKSLMDPFFLNERRNRLRRRLMENR